MAKVFNSVGELIGKTPILQLHKLEKLHKTEYSVIPDECGDGTDALCYTGTMKAVGDITVGVFAKSSGTFSKK